MTIWTPIIIGGAFAINPLLGFFVLWFEMIRVADDARERDARSEREENERE